MVPGAVNAESVGLNKDHVGLAKFDQEYDGDFVILSNHISQMAKQAPAENTSRWDLYRRRESKQFHIIYIAHVLITHACRRGQDARSRIQATASSECNIHGTRKLSGEATNALSSADWEDY